MTAAGAPDTEDPLEQAWRDGGWGPRRATPVPDREPPLLFSLRWPLGWDATALQAGFPGGDGPQVPREPEQVSALDRLRAWQHTPGAIVTERVTRRLDRPGGSEFPLIVTMSAVLAPLGPPPEPAEVDADAMPVRTAGHPGVRVRTVREALIPGVGRMRVLVVRQLLETEHGTLALAFAAPQHDFRDVLEPLCDAVAETVRLDPWRPGPPAEETQAPAA